MSKLETPAAEHPSTTKPARAAWHFYRSAATLKEDYARAAAF